MLPPIWLRLLRSGRFLVSGTSMLPGLRSGDRLLVDRVAYRRRKPVRGEIVVFQHPTRPSVQAVKRVVGVPGEAVLVRRERLLVAGTLWPEPYIATSGASTGTFEWLLVADEYLLLGDNRAESDDSRLFGPVPGALLHGPAWYRYWPPDRRAALDG
jgi:signal peptidase I